MSRYGETKLYVGDLGHNATKPEIEDAFSYYGPVRNVWVARNPPGFAFVEFEDARDAEDAVRGLDGRTICGRRARVEYSSARRGGGGHPRNRRGDDRCYDCGGRGHYARDCNRGRNRRRSRSRSPRRQRRSRTRSRSASRSRSRSRSVRSKSRTPRSHHSKSRSLSKDSKN